MTVAASICLSVSMPSGLCSISFSLIVRYSSGTHGSSSESLVRFLGGSLEVVFLLVWVHTVEPLSEEGGGAVEPPSEEGGGAVEPPSEEGGGGAVEPPSEEGGGGAVEPPSGEGGEAVEPPSEEGGGAVELVWLPGDVRASFQQ